jgi:bifunctional N-acetylglucosamine-1-phosphate-uridyltransferase/glucosamine-1-phosphate-acetyltransferase GlmU-like protein
MINLSEFISQFRLHFEDLIHLPPWAITGNLPDILIKKISTLDHEYFIKDNIAIHITSIVEDHAILKPPVIIGPGCFVGANAYLRNGVFLGEKSSVGPGCEVKTSMIFSHTEIAHLNFIGDSIIGSEVNMEAGSITANYFNERQDKIISVLFNGNIISTGVNKFGSLVGDRCKVGANAVLSPGTILPRETVIKRLQLIEQVI